MRIDNRLLQYEEIAKSNAGTSSAASGGSQDSSFGDILRQTLEADTLVFSKHAEQRLQQRNIALSTEELTQLNNAARMAGEKGIHNSLILMEDRAFIVNIPSSTVITAMDGSDMKDNVFTKIDGAVIV